MSLYKKSDIPDELLQYFKPAEIGLEETPEEFVEKLVEVFRGVKRVLTDDGTLWLNLGDSYNGSGGDHKEHQQNNSGFQGAYGAKNHKGIGRYLNTLKPKDLIGIPWKTAFALQQDGWYLRQDIIWHKPNPMPESVTDRCTKSHEYIFLLSKSQHYFFDNKAIQEPAIYAGDDRGARNDSRRGTECNSMSGKTGEFRNKRSVWTVNTKPYKGSHFATFPEELITPCILSGCPVGGTVLDPFGGAGTTAYVSKYLGRKAVSIELNEKYIDLQIQRVKQEYLEVFVESPVEEKQNIEQEDLF